MAEIRNFALREKNRRTEGYGYPRTFVCTFCKQEFASITSLFSHMSEIHEVPNKSA